MPVLGERLRTFWNNNKMEHSTVEKINNLVLNSSTWVNHRNITLNKKANGRGIPFIRILENSLNSLHFKNACVCPHVPQKS